MTTTTVSSGVTSTGFVVTSGNQLLILSGGTAVSAFVLSGGILSATSGAFDSAAKISSGGTLIATQVGTGATFQNATSDTVLLGGTAIAGSRGWLQNTTVFGSVIVSAAGFAQDAIVSNGGSLTVSASGSANAAVVSSGGTAILSPGGGASYTLVSSGRPGRGLCAEALAPAPNNRTVCGRSGGASR